MKKLFIVISVLAAALLIPAPAKAAVGDSAKKVMCDWIKGRNWQVSEPVQTVCTGVGITLPNVRPGTAHQPTLDELAAIVQEKTQALATAQASYQDAADAYSAYMEASGLESYPCPAVVTFGPNQCALGGGRDPEMDPSGHASELWDAVLAANEARLDAQAELDQAQQDYDDAAPPVIITPPVTPPVFDPCSSNPLLPECRK